MRNLDALKVYEDVPFVTNCHRRGSPGCTDCRFWRFEEGFLEREIW